MKEIVLLNVQANISKLKKKISEEEIRHKNARIEYGKNYRLCITMRKDIEAIKEVVKGKFFLELFHFKKF